MRQKVTITGAGTGPHPTPGGETGARPKITITGAGTGPHPTSGGETGVGGGNTYPGVCA